MIARRFLHPALVPVVLVCLSTPRPAAAQGVELRVAERTTIPEGAAVGGGNPAIVDEATWSLAVLGDRYRLEDLWVLDLEADEGIRLSTDATPVPEPLGEILAPPIELPEVSWNVEITGEEGEVEGLPTYRVLLSSGAVDALPLFGFRGAFFADVRMSRDSRLEPLISFQRAHGPRLGPWAPAYRVLDMSPAALRALLAETDGFPVEVTFYLVELDAGAPFRPDALLDPEGSGPAPGQRLRMKRSTTLAGSVRTDVPASRFEPPPGAVARDAPLISDTLKALTESEGIEEAVRFFREAAENRPRDFHFDFDEIRSMASRHRSEMLGVGPDSEIDREKAEVAMALWRLLIEAFPEDPQYHAALATTAAMAGDEERAVESYRRAFDLNPRAEAVRRRLAELGAEPDPAHGRPVGLPPRMLERYEGEYLVGTRAGRGYPTDQDPLFDPDRWTITAAGGALVVERGSRDPLRFVPLAEGQFVNAEEGLLINFVGGPERRVHVLGRTTELRWIGRRIGPPGG